MHLLDTDTLTHLHAGNANVIQQLSAVDDAVVGITLVTKIELLRGRMDYLLKAVSGEDLLRAQYLLERTEMLLTQILVVLFDQRSIAQFDRLQALRNLRKIGRADLLIASVALANRATLVTRNLRHFKQVPQLVVVNWVD